MIKSKKKRSPEQRFATTGERRWPLIAVTLIVAGGLSALSFSFNERARSLKRSLVGGSGPTADIPDLFVNVRTHGEGVGFRHLVTDASDFLSKREPLFHD